MVAVQLDSPQLDLHAETAAAAAKRLHVLADVMDAKDRGAALERGDRGADGRGGRAGRGSLVPEDLPEHALPREPDEHRPSKREQDVEPSHELEIVGDRLAEADSRIEADSLLGDSRVDCEFEPLLQKRRDVGRDVVVARLELHRSRLALHVHQAEVGARVRDDAGELGIGAERRHVVHELDAELEGAPRDLRLGRVDRKG